MNQNKSSEQQKPTSYEALSDDQRDCAVAIRIMGWTLHPCPGIALPNGPSPGGEWGWKTATGEAVWKKHFCPSTDDNAARLVRNKIAELGMATIRLYENELALLVWPEEKLRQGFSGADHFAFGMQQATPSQISIAALRALDASKEQQG